MTIALIVLGLLAAFVLFLRSIEKSMIYYPSPDIDWTPATAHMAFEDLRLRCADGVTIHGWFVPAATPSRATILFFHGNAGSIGHRFEKILILHALPLDVCIIDYHGYGKSEGRPNEQNTYLDAEAAYEWLTRQRQIAPKHILVWGESLGGGVATWLAARREVGGLVLESTFTSLPDVGKRLLPFVPLRWIMATRYDSLGRIRQVRAPVLSLHSPQDEVIPYALGRKLYDAANPPKMFVELTGDHNGGFVQSGDAFPNGVRAFLDKYFAGQ